MQGLPSDAAIRDSIAAVFRSPEYGAAISETLWDRLLRFIGRVLGALLDIGAEFPALNWAALILLGGFAVAVVARAAYLGAQRAKLSARLARSGAGDEGFAGNPWQHAHQLAAAGRYTDAAHALYRYLLDWLSGAQRIQLHESKTVGDYGRELRDRSPDVFTGYRDFARLYEVVVYGLRACDSDRYHRLLQLANAITGRHG